MTSAVPLKGDPYGQLPAQRHTRESHRRVRSGWVGSPVIDDEKRRHDAADDSGCQAPPFRPLRQRKEEESETACSVDEEKGNGC